MSPDKCSAQAARQGRSVVKVAFPQPATHVLPLADSSASIAWSVAALSLILVWAGAGRGRHARGQHAGDGQADALFRRPHRT